MEYLIAAGITTMALVGCFAVPVLLAMVATLAVAYLDDHREKGVGTSPSMSAARLSGAAAYVLAAGLLLAPGSFAEDLPTSQVTNGPEREKYRLWPVDQYPNSTPVRNPMLASR